MDTLPTELHAYICQLACTDDGSTVRTLNAVSKYFQEFSRPYLYHNVSAFGMAQILGLLERLERTPPHMRHIHHLFLSDVPSDSSSKSPFRLSDFENQALSRIITLSAPTLETLSLVANAPFSSTSLIARVFRTPFPLLHSLAISGFYPFPSSLGKFPSLKRLHLNGNRNPHGLLHMCSLEEACPSLTDLKITGLGAAGAFVTELEDALIGEQGWDGLSDCMTPTRLPPSVRRIVVQAGPEPVLNQSEALPGTTVMKDRVLLSRLESLKSRKVEGADQVQVLVLDRCLTAISAEDIRRSWISGLLR